MIEKIKIDFTDYIDIQNNPIIKVGFYSVDKVESITDSISATGLVEGNYKLGELDIRITDGQARSISNNALARSVLTLDRA